VTKWAHFSRRSNDNTIITETLLLLIIYRVDVQWIQNAILPWRKFRAMERDWKCFQICAKFCDFKNWHWIKNWLQFFLEQPTYFQ